MAAVVSVLRTSLVAVPALSRVEPASTSGPDAGRRAECRRTLRRLGNAEPAARAGTDEDRAATAAERRDDRVHRRRDLAPDARHRQHGPAVLAVHQRGDAERREAVEGAARTVLLLGGEPRVANSRGRHARMLLLSGGCPPSDAGSRSSSTTSRHSSKA